MGQKLYEKFIYRFKPINNAAKNNATRKIFPITKKLRLTFYIDGSNDNIDLNVAKNIKYEIVLGIDFAIQFRIKVYAARHEWRVRGFGKKWQQFSNKDANANRIV